MFPTEAKTKVSHVQNSTEVPEITEYRLKESTCLVWETLKKGKGKKEKNFYLMILALSQTTSTTGKKILQSKFEKPRLLYLPHKYFQHRLVYRTLPVMYSMTAQ